MLGLGNPGERYRLTRHNLGFRTLDCLAERCGVPFAAAEEIRPLARVARVRLGGSDVVLAKPRTYMNRSVRAAAALCTAYDAEPLDLVVVFDDADLALGRLRVRAGGGAGGHNGIRSLIDVLGHGDFSRVRLGVRGNGRDDRELADYVLEPFEADEEPLAQRIAAAGADAVECLLGEGLVAAMNRFNGLELAGPAGPQEPPEQD